MPFRNGGHVFGGNVRKGVKTFSHYLRPLGYETALIGKASLHPAVRTRTHKYILNLNSNERFITHLSRCGPDRQPQATHPFWKSWEKEAEKDEGAKRIVNRYYFRPVEELYDLRSDPHEQDNTAGDPGNAKLLISLRRHLREWRKTQNGRVPVYLAKEYVAPSRFDPISVANEENTP